MRTSLEKLKNREKGIVAEINEKGVMRRRLLEMGITCGCEIMIKKRAPLGDPIQIRLRGYEMMIRKKDAENIIMERSDNR